MKSIKVHELKKLLDKDAVHLIDVREHDEHKSEHIKGSCLIPLSELSIEKLPSNTKPIVIYCRSGKRSSVACVKLLAVNSLLDVASLEGGIVAWMNSGLSVKRSGYSIASQDRKKQIAVVFISLIAGMLGAFINPFFYIISGVIGAGLIFAGATSYLDKLINKQI